MKGLLSGFIKGYQSQFMRGGTFWHFILLRILKVDLHGTTSSHATDTSLYTGQIEASTSPPLPGIPRACDTFSCPVGREFDHHSWGVGYLITSLDIMLRVALIPHGLINHERKDCVFLVGWVKTKGLHKLCSVFEGV